MPAGQRIGCQTFSWEMLGSEWHGTTTDILDAVAAAGYAGIEISNVMIGDYFEDPDRLARDLEERGLELVGYAFATTGFTDAAAFEADVAGVRAGLDFCRQLGVPMYLGGASAPSRDDYEEKFAQAIKFYRAAAEEGERKGILVCVHPHSHHGSLLESAQEYDRLLEATADSGLMFNPDAGHVVRGGQDLMDCFRRHRDRIRHVHIKDVDAWGAWQPLGQGIIDWKALFDFLTDTDYVGWIVAEEESQLAWDDPANAIAVNRAYLRTQGL
jgi:inosose dehydratase